MLDLIDRVAAGIGGCGGSSRVVLIWDREVSLMWIFLWNWPNCLWNSLEAEAVVTQVGSSL